MPATQFVNHIDLNPDHLISPKAWYSGVVLYAGWRNWYGSTGCFALSAGELDACYALMALESQMEAAQ